MSVSDLAPGLTEYTATCSICGGMQTIMSQNKRTAPKEFRALGWVIPESNPNRCPGCANEANVTLPIASFEPVVHHMTPEESGQLREAMKARHDEMFGLTGEWER